VPDFLHAFIPIFVAVDIAGLIPVFLTLTKGLSLAQRRRVASQALFTAFAIGVLFILCGRLIFKIIGITVADFEMAGGLLLLVFAVIEILQRGPREKMSNLSAGPVPLGTPLVVGPAVLTALLILVPNYGYAMTFGAFTFTIALVGLSLYYSQSVTKIVHENGLRAISQVINLFLAAIGVSLIRRGVEAVLLAR